MRTIGRSRNIKLHIDGVPQSIPGGSSAPGISMCAVNPQILDKRTHVRAPAMGEGNLSWSSTRSLRHNPIERAIKLRDGRQCRSRLRVTAALILRRAGVPLGGDQQARRRSKGADLPAGGVVRRWGQEPPYPWQQGACRGQRSRFVALRLEPHEGGARRADHRGCPKSSLRVAL